MNLFGCALLPPEDHCDEATQFHCQETRACVKLTELCDYADNCGDLSDEANCNGYTRFDFEAAHNHNISVLDWHSMKHRPAGLVFLVYCGSCRRGTRISVSSAMQAQPSFSGSAGTGSSTPARPSTTRCSARPATTSTSRACWGCRGTRPACCPQRSPPARAALSGIPHQHQCGVSGVASVAVFASS